MVVGEPRDRETSGAARIAELERALAREHLLVEVARDIANALDLQVILDRSLARLAEVMDFRAASIALRDLSDGLEIRAQYGDLDAVARAQHLRLGEQVEARGAPVLTADLEADSRGKARAGERAVRAYLAAPLTARGRTLGVLQLEGATRGAFHETDQSLVTSLAILLSGAIDAVQMIQARDEFLSFVTHELKTPITAIRGYAQILKRHFEQVQAGAELNMGRALESLATINNQTDRLRRLVDELLDVSRIEMRRVALDPSRFDLLSALERWVGNLRQAHEGRAIRLLRKNGVKSLPVEADLQRIEQVVTNLVNNALQYSDEDRSVVVAIGRAERDGRAYAEVSVKDQGIGIAPEDLPHIFDRYHRSVGARRKRREGMGVGLFISSEMLRFQGGEITCQSTLGKGSVFTFRLPLVR